MRADDVPRKWVVEGAVAHFGLLDGLRQRCFSILTPPHCGTNYTAVLCKLLLSDDAANPHWPKTQNLCLGKNKNRGTGLSTMSRLGRGFYETSRPVISGPRLHPDYTQFRLRLHDRSQLNDVSRSAPWNGKPGNSASASSRLSASSTLRRERSTSSSKVSTSGDLRFERKLSKLQNSESIRLPSVPHKSHMGSVTKNERGSTKFAPSPVFPPSVSLAAIHPARLSLAARTVVEPRGVPAANGDRV